MIDKINYCEGNISDFELQVRKITRKSQLVGTIRVIWFIMFLIVFVYLVNDRQLQWAILSFVMFVLGFGFLVILFNRLKFSQKHLNYLIQINHQEINRLQNDFSGLDDGSAFIDIHHPYAVDLDIFGSSSIYQLINRTATIPGSTLLVNRLLGRSTLTDPLAYQEAVKELSAQPHFIHEYQALGMHFDIQQEDYDNFNTWLGNDDSLISINRHSYLLYGLPTLFLLGFILTTLLSITYYALLPIIAVNLYILGINHKLSSKTVEQTSSVVQLLRAYLHHLRLIKETGFDTSYANQLKEALIKGENDAEQEIKQLSRLLDHLQARNNLLHIFINIPLLLDLQWLTRLIKWKSANRTRMGTWINSLADFEVLVSLSGTAFMNPEWCFPALSDEEYILHGKAFGHPLILEEKRVCNDFSLIGSAKAIIVTGPNMAGKSTFLRTLALNVVLAQMGGPVCASDMMVSKGIKVFTAMRTQDNLSENISSFYAELDRIKQLLEYINSNPSVLYFLDELLKGTNSADRHRGAEALVQQLIKLKVSGFVSTHDIELGELTQQLKEVSNYSFESTISDGKISFDYKIREGICSSFNASELMRQMGIDI